MKTIVKPKPFVKWVGGKRSILNELTERMPDTFTTYNEMFLGGGALFFSSEVGRAKLSDINPYLINTYIAVRDDLKILIRKLKVHKRFNSKDYFLRARVRLHKEKDPTTNAALFIYLNKTCFNGLFRVNQKGGFNVPFAKYENPNILDEENLLECNTKLKGVKICQQGFEDTKIYKSNFYYIDPPYHKTFSQYDKNGFGEESHRKLAKMCEKIDMRNGKFMQSNSATPFIRELYSNFKIEVVKASRNVSCKGEGRGRTDELLIRNY